MNRPSPSLPQRKRNESGTEEQRVAAEGDAEERDAQERHRGDIDEADGEVGQELAEDDLDPGHRRRGELLHGAALPLAGDGQRGEHRRDDHHDHRDEPGDDHVAAGEGLVVPDSRLGGERQRQPFAVEDDALAERCRHSLGVAERDRRRIGVGAVEEKLDGRGAAGSEVGGEAGRDDQHEAGRAAGEELRRVAGALRARREMKVAGGEEAVEELAALGVSCPGRPRRARCRARPRRWRSRR